MIFSIAGTISNVLRLLRVEFLMGVKIVTSNMVANDDAFAIDVSKSGNQTSEIISVLRMDRDDLKEENFFLETHFKTVEILCTNIVAPR